MVKFFVFLKFGVAIFDLRLVHNMRATHDLCCVLIASGFFSEI